MTAFHMDIVHTPHMKINQAEMGPLAPRQFSIVCFLPSIVLHHLIFSRMCFNHQILQSYSIFTISFHIFLPSQPSPPQKKMFFSSKKAPPQTSNGSTHRDGQSKGEDSRDQSQCCTHCRTSCKTSGTSSST